MLAGSSVACSVTATEPTVQATNTEAVSDIAPSEGESKPCKTNKRFTT